MVLSDQSKQTEKWRNLILKYGDILKKRQLRLTMWLNHTLYGHGHVMYDVMTQSSDF